LLLIFVRNFASEIANQGVASA